MSTSRRKLVAMGVGALAFAGLGMTAIAVADGSGSAKDGWEHTPLSIEQIQREDALLVDIRTPPEWLQTGVIEGAKLVEFDFERPMTFLPQIAAELADGRDLILICRSGNRTQAVAEFLAPQIENHVVSVKGGVVRVFGEGYRPVRAVLPN